MTPLSESLLHQVAGQVLEECAFLFTQPGPEPEVWPEPVTCATLTFAGPRKGKVELYAAHGLAMAIAADMLGLEADDPEAHRLADNSIAEIANVITGALVAELFGTECLCELGIPVVAHEAPGPRSESSFALTLIDLEGRPLDLRVSLEPSL